MIVCGVAGCVVGGGRALWWGGVMTWGDGWVCVGHDCVSRLMVAGVCLRWCVCGACVVAGSVVLGVSVVLLFMLLDVDACYCCCVVWEGT
jgi:hypothetical protein